MSYEKDLTYLRMAEGALNRYEDALRDVPELRGLPTIRPTPWGDPQFVLKIDSSVTAERRQEIIDLVQGEPVVPVVFKLIQEQ